MYLKHKLASKGPGNRDQCKRPWDKDIFATFCFHGTSVTFSWQNLVKPILFSLKLGMGHVVFFPINIEPHACVLNMGQRLFKRQN